MKEALLKKRCGIPAALLVALSMVLVSSGTALAWYGFGVVSSKTTVQEALSTGNEKEFSAAMYPGETKTWSFDIVNSAKVDYSVKADLSYDAPSGISITDFTVGDGDETGDLTEDGTAMFVVPAGTTVTCSMTISAEQDADTGTVSVSLNLSRE